MNELVCSSKYASKCGSPPPSRKQKRKGWANGKSDKNRKILFL